MTTTEIYMANDRVGLQARITTTTEIDKQFWPMMAERFDLKLIPEFSSMDPNQSIIE